MTILTVAGGVEDSVGIIPSLIFINTNDTYAGVLASGYLNNWVGFTFKETQEAHVNTTDGLAILQVSIVGSTISLVSMEN